MTVNSGNDRRRVIPNYLIGFNFDRMTRIKITSMKNFMQSYRVMTHLSYILLKCS